MKLEKKHWLYGIKLLIALVLIALLLQWISIGKAFSYLQQIHPVYFLFALIVVLFVNVAKMLRFYYLAHDLKIGIGFKENLIAHCIAPIIGRLTPAKLGEGVKILFLKNDKKRLGFAFIVEKLGDTASLIIVASFALLSIGSYYNVYATFIILIFIGMVALWNIERILNFVLKKKVLEDHWFKQSLQDISLSQWISFLAFTTLIRFLILSVPYIMALGFGLSVNISLAFQLYAIAMVVSAVSGLPGGLGAREVSLSFLLVQYAALGKEVAGIIALLTILADLLIESVIAVVGYVWYRMEKNKVP